MANNLTSLAAVSAWLNEDPATNTDNLLLSRLIASASGFLLRYLNRPPLFQQTYSETYDGSGGTRLVLRNYPVLSVSSLTVGAQAITASAAYGQAGYRLEAANAAPPGTPQALDLTGYSFTRGGNNVAVTYTAGYVVQNEAHTVPASNYTIAVNAPYGNWGADAGVTYASGAALVAVTGTPSVGQYVVSPTTGIYTFAAADTGAAVLISYSYIPSDIEQACIEIVAERYMYRGRIGQASKTLAGQETISYSLKSMQDYTREALASYRDVLLH